MKELEGKKHRKRQKSPKIQLKHSVPPFKHSCNVDLKIFFVKFQGDKHSVFTTYIQFFERGGKGSKITKRCPGDLSRLQKLVNGQHIYLITEAATESVL